MAIPPWMVQFNDLWLFNDLKYIETKLTKPNTMVAVGQFFEVLTASILDIDHAKVPNEEVDVWPDCIDNHTNTIYEVKGSRSGRWIVDIAQMKLYRKYFSAKIFYVLYSYKLPLPCVHYETIRNLIRALTKAVEYALLVPISYMEKAQKTLKNYEYGEWSRAYRRNRQDRGYLRLNMKGSELFKPECLNGKAKKTMTDRVWVIRYKVNPFPLYEINE